MTQSGNVLTRKEGNVGTVTFNNPERHNAMSLEMWQQTEAALATFASDDDVRVVVLTGAGDKAFVSGADISRFEKERGSEEAVSIYNAATDRAFTAIYEFPKPTIAMIRGYCIGGGCALAISCDMRVATDKSRFGIPAAKLGLGYSYGGVKRLVDLVGPSFAKEILFTARQFSAEEARTMGLVNRVVPDAGLAPAVAEIAEMIAANAPLTVAAVKATVGEALKDAGERDLKRLQAMVDKCFASSDYQEGRRAFMEKRKPAFTGT